MAFGDTRYAGTVRAFRKLAKRYRYDCVWNALLLVEIFSDQSHRQRCTNHSLVKF
jgi:hypothetical protein